MGEANILRLLESAEIDNGFHIGRLDGPIGRIFEVGQTVPGGVAGYCPGAIFMDSNATGANNVLFTNEGTLAVANFQPVST